MDVLVSHGLGLDVPKKSVMACRITPDPTGRQADGIMERRQYGPMPFDWLAEAGITPVAMQSTGEYGQPVLNLLEGNVAVCLVNAAHMKQVPGRKTNKPDACWLTNRMREGMLTARFSPPQGQRDRRDLTRYRTKVVQERSGESDRVLGVLERANIKLAAVVEGRADPAMMAALAKGRRRCKIPLLEQALTGLMRDHHRRVLVMQWAHIDFLDAQIEMLNTAIAGGLRALDPGEPPALPPAPAMTGEDTVKPASPLPLLTYERAIALWDTIPGIDRRATEVWVAETGMEMAHFGTASRLAAVGRNRAGQ